MTGFGRITNSDATPSLVIPRGLKWEEKCIGQPYFYCRRSKRVLTHTGTLFKTGYPTFPSYHMLKVIQGNSVHCTGRKEVKRKKRPNFIYSTDLTPSREPGPPHLPRRPPSSPCRPGPWHLEGVFGTWRREVERECSQSFEDRVNSLIKPKRQ